MTVIAVVSYANCGQEDVEVHSEDLNPRYAWNRKMIEAAGFVCRHCGDHLAEKAPTGLIGHDPMDARARFPVISGDLDKPNVPPSAD